MPHGHEDAFDLLFINIAIWLLLQQCLGRLRTLALLSELLPLQLVESAVLCQLAKEALVAAWRSEVRPVAWCRCWC